MTVRESGIMDVNDEARNTQARRKPGWRSPNDERNVRSMSITRPVVWLS